MISDAWTGHPRAHILCRAAGPGVFFAGLRALRIQRRMAFSYSGVTRGRWRMKCTSFQLSTSSSCGPFPHAGMGGETNPIMNDIK